MLRIARTAALLTGLAALPGFLAAGDAGAIEGLWCFEKNALAVVSVGKDIEFAIFSSRNGSFCSASGRAIPSGDGWVYRSDELGPCKILVVASARGVRLETPDDRAACLGNCGASNQIEGLDFPASARVSATGDRNLVDAVENGGLAPCTKRQ